MRYAGKLASATTIWSEVAHFVEHLQQFTGE